MVAYTTRLPVGFPGRVSRSDSLTIQQEIIDSGTPPTVYGGAVKLVSGKLRPIASGDAATVVTGLLVCAYPTQSATNTFGATTPPTSGVADVLKRGYMTITLARGTAAKDGALYVRITAATGKAVGDFEVAADSGNCVALNAKFMGPSDSTGVTEVAYNI